MSMKNELLKHSRKGQVAGAVIAVISGATIIFIGIWVISLVQNSISQTGWSAQANATYSNAQSIAWNAIQLLTVALVVLAAAVILSYFGFGGMSKAE